VSTVCSDHFKDDSYHHTAGYTKTKRLLSTAVPVLNKCSAVLKVTDNIMIPSIQYDASSCIDETDVSQEVSFSELEGIEMTTNEKNSINSKR